MAQVKSVTALPDGNVIIAYDNNKTAKKSALEAAGEIATAKLAGAYQVSPNTPNTNAGPAFGSTPATGGATNNVTVTPENLTAYYQQALSSKADGYAKIRKALLGAGLISKGTKSLTSVQNAWLGVLQGASNDGLDPYTYIAKIKATGAGLDTTDQTPKDYSQVTVWNPTKAKSYITQLGTDILKRDVTDAEITDIQNKLAAAQKKNPSKTVYTKDKNGKTVATTTGGIDEQQFVTDILKANPEYKALKEAGTNAALQSVMDAARANGITLAAEDAAKYAERVRNGEKIDEVASMFRKIASVSQPQRIADLLNSGVDLKDIYAPYKSAMAKTLEIDPNTIDFTDPALSNAITGDKTMTTYEFQRALRKDPRWQYTDNAREEAAGVATQVLKDFGFQG